MNDNFVHNTRSELASAQINGTLYGYDKAPDGCKGDWTNLAAGLPRRGEGAMGRAQINIGNRRMAMEAGNYAIYRTNALNQYTDITGAEREEEYTFTPTFDADGNQTLVKTTTGIWTVTYNAENRPVRFTRSEEDGTETQVTCTYDYMGRRATKKVTNNGEITLYQRYIYRDYFQIACCDQTLSTHPSLWLITWDLTKNICEVFSSNGYINTIYTYTPYGEVTSSGSTTQPLQWSSEYSDTELGLVYYNYRHYNPIDGRWLGRDVLGEAASQNVYGYVYNKPYKHIDYTGLVIDTIWDVGNMIWDVGAIVAGAATGDGDMVEEGATDLLLDTAAAFIPGVPAGASKAARAAQKAARQAEKEAARRSKKLQNVSLSMKVIMCLVISRVDARNAPAVQTSLKYWQLGAWKSVFAENF